MKRVLLILIIIVGSFFLYKYVKDNSNAIKKIVVAPKSSINSSIEPQTDGNESLFVPYWTIGKSLNTDSFSSLIYFGISADLNGIDVTDAGYKNLPKFISLAKNKDKILAVRMIDKGINSEVLKDSLLQKKIANDAVGLAKINNFNGVMLDFETSAFGFESTTKRISAFYSVFSKIAHQNGLPFSVTLYGDSYFRARAYDIKTIASLSDKVFVMAYDFSKSNGNPGPVFPFIDNKMYGYDFSKMVDDFQKEVPNNKIIITLGYFGYDWQVDKDGQALALGVPMSTNEITHAFINNCEYKSCILSRTDVGQEPNIKYTNDSGENHVVWFEDNISVGRKKEFLKSKGILSTADWAYTYY